MISKNLAAKPVIFAAAMTFFTSGAFLNGQVANAGIPVIDAANVSQNVLSAIENIAQTAQQIQEYQTQLQQYENQLLNTMAPASYIWDQAQSTMNALVDATDTLSYYKNQLGSIDSYLSNFQDVDYYRSSPCFTEDGCSDAERAALEEARTLSSDSEKKANDAIFKGLDKHQENIRADARRLRFIQAGAESADGQLAAIGYANQLASNQSTQLLQIRSLLVAQQNAIAARNQAQANREAQEQAAAEQLRRGEFEESPEVVW